MLKYLYHVSVAPGLHYDCIAEDGLQLAKKDEVVVRCDRYVDYGTVVDGYDGKPVDENALDARATDCCKGRKIEGQRIPRIIRRATLVDKSKQHENEMREKSMHRQAQGRIEMHQLNMKLVNTHFSFDKRLVVFQFTAEGRVDFRELLRDLSQELHTRVELRQIGVRDEAAVQGGIGTCGRPFCCATFLSNFTSINVKMAKEQGLSLNPTNISGACGRLKCCLSYEAAFYRERNRAAKAAAGGREAGKEPLPAAAGESPEEAPESLTLVTTPGEDTAELSDDTANRGQNGAGGRSTARSRPQPESPGPATRSRQAPQKPGR